MNLSKLVYLCIKNAIYYDDTSFSFENFKKGAFNGNPDYANNINNVYLPLNEAIARLSDLERIPYKVFKVESITDGIVSLSSIEQKNNVKIKEVINVATLPDCNKIEHRNLGGDKLILSGNYDPNKVYVEIKEDMPHFDSSNYYYKKDSNDLVDEYDVNMRDYNINDGMCNYIMEYVMGRLTEQINAEISNMHITRAEQYFNNIRPNNSNFTQKIIKTLYKVGE